MGACLKITFETMKLLSLKLNNFRQHQASAINFSDGLTGIIGHNGSGKSTVVEAMAFALYGSKALRGKVEDVHTYGISRQETTLVELSFEHESQVYKIVRTLNQADIFKGGQDKALVSGNKAVSLKTEEILGLNIDEFLSSYYTEQKALEFLSGKKGTTEREKFIIKMIGYDKLEKLQQALREDRRDLKNKISGLESGLGDKEFIEKQILEEKKALETLKQEEKEAVKVLQNAEKGEEVAKKTFLELGKDYEEYQNYQQELRYFNETEEKLFQRLKEQEIKESENKERLEKKINDTDFLVDEDFSYKLNLLEKEIPEFEKQILNITEEAETAKIKFQEELNQKKSELVVLEAEAKNLETKIKTLKKLKTGGHCPTCNQVLGEEFKQVMEGLLAKQQDNYQEIKEAENELKKISQTPDKITALDESLSELKEKLRTAQNTKNTLHGLQQEILAIKNTKEQLLVLEKEIKDNKTSSELLNEKITQLNFKETDYKSAKAKYEAAQGLVQASRLQKVRLEGKMREQSAMLKRSEGELLEQEEKRADLKEYKKQQLLLDESDQVLSDFRHALNASIRPRLSELASQYMAELSDGRYTSLEVSDTFSPVIYEDGILKNVLSGGEEDLVNLCLRLSLSGLIAERAGHSLSFLILDEVFGSLDENRRFNVLTLLERLQNRFEQILVITHLDDIKDGVSNLLYVSYDESRSELSLKEQEEGEGELNF